MQEYLGLSGESQGPCGMELCLFRPGPKEPQEREQWPFLQKLEWKNQLSYVGPQDAELPAPKELCRPLSHLAE